VELTFKCLNVCPKPRTGLFLAPQTTGEALKGGRLVAEVMHREGYHVVPPPGTRSLCVSCLRLYMTPSFLAIPWQIHIVVWLPATLGSAGSNPAYSFDLCQWEAAFLSAPFLPLQASHRRTPWLQQSSCSQRTGWWPSARPCKRCAQWVATFDLSQVRGKCKCNHLYVCGQ